MPGLVPGIHAFCRRDKKDVDGRDKPGHDDGKRLSPRQVEDALGDDAEHHL